MRVGATSANLGAGFDSLGLAWEMFDDIKVDVTDADDTITIQGEGATDLPKDSSHLIAAIVRRELARRGIVVPGLRISCKNRIPQSRGLGSSAAATVAAHTIVAALSTPLTSAIDRDAIFAAAAIDEGHPDNVAPCVFGGLTIAWQGSDGVFDCASLPVLESVGFSCAVPQRKSATAKARAVLPTQVPMTDAVFNIGRASAMVAALTMEPSLLLAAMDDRLHERQRRRQWPASYALVQELRSVGIASAISGAGPSVLIAYPKAAAARVRKTIALLAPADTCVVHTRINGDGLLLERC